MKKMKPSTCFARISNKIIENITITEVIMFLYGSSQTASEYLNTVTTLFCYIVYRNKVSIRKYPSSCISFQAAKNVDFQKLALNGQFEINSLRKKRCGLEL
ncbi:hypothetical protein CHS0354_040161 [Potamilus streckersoni]|uniref:Uncharacterized protein n=1 Tax=Potamilus streckersoni TaxID=2493646 RepID=A0AAE0ST34_9BIVA|nr:hypothetical protein CHS0354_040161 [Potamilus streckersoni]